MNASHTFQLTRCWHWHWTQIRFGVSCERTDMAGCADVQFLARSGILTVCYLPLYLAGFVTYFLSSGNPSERVGTRVGRSRGFTSVLVQMQRQAERDARARAAAQRHAQVEAVRARRAFERAVAADQKERAHLYNESRIAEVAALNERLTADIAELDGLFRSTLAVDDFLDFETLKEAAPRPQFEPG